VPDVRAAVRSLRATPIVTLAATLSLALGIGGVTAIFSLVNSILIRPLPVKEPDRLAIITQGDTRYAQSWTYAIWDAVRERSAAFDGMASWSAQRFNLSESGERQPVDGAYVSGSYFATLGVPALIGRTFTPADDARGGGPDGPVAVISYAFWQRYYAGAASAIGSRLTVNRVPFTIVGVTPPRFFGVEVGGVMDIAVPIGCEPLMHGAATALDRRSNWWLTMIVRMKPGQSVDAATAALRAIQPQVRAAAMPGDLDAERQADFMKEPFVLEPGASGISILRYRYERPLLTILVTVGLVLLIACANIANLQLGRAIARRHELSVRVALGAPAWRLGRELLIESLVLSAGGAALGLLTARWAANALVAQLSTSTNHVFLDLALDWRVLAFTATVTCVTAVLFGTAPAILATRVAPIEALKENGRTTDASGGFGVSNALVVGQVALSLVLVVGAGLFVRTFVRLVNVPLGFDRDELLVISVSPRAAATAGGFQFDGITHEQAVDQRIALYQRLAETVSAVPGVAHAAASVVTPVSGSTWMMNVEIPGAPQQPTGNSNPVMNIVTPGWFAVYGVRILAGRDIDVHDTAAAPHVALVNETLVKNFFPGRNPIGGVIKYPNWSNGPAMQPRRIVGVVSDSVYRNLREAPRPTIFSPLAQYDNFGNPLSGISLTMRSASGSPAMLTRSVAAALTRAQPDLEFSFRPLKDQVGASLAQERLVAALSGVFGGLALLLAGLGLYGVTAYAVSRRRREIGIRIALGSSRASVVRLVLGRIAVLVGTGAVIGVAASMWAVRFVGALLFGIDPHDGVTIAGAISILAVVGLLAGSLPAWRAARVDPMLSLRVE
jgi:putative ABC transport system permease protein